MADTPNVQFAQDLGLIHNSTQQRLLTDLLEVKKKLTTDMVI